MPWVDKDRCSGCGICVEECPVGVIVMENETAEINMDEALKFLKDKVQSQILSKEKGKLDVIGKTHL